MIDDEMAEAMSRELMDQSYECMICCEAVLCCHPRIGVAQRAQVKRQQHVWSCATCFHVFHIRCIQQWAGSSVATSADEGTSVSTVVYHGVLQLSAVKWRCPGCQTVVERVPKVLISHMYQMN